MSTRATLKNPADVLMFAAIDCAHGIDDEKIVIQRDSSKPGNALRQLTKRLEEALPRAAAGLIPLAAPRMNDAGRVALALARKAAKTMRNDAALGGQYDDGGAGHLELLCDAFEAGQRGTVPGFLREYVKQAERDADPEYALYQRLHEKFGGKA